MKKAVAFSTLILMLTTALLYPIATHAQMTEVQQAEADARRDVGQDVSAISWGVGGFFAVYVPWLMFTLTNLKCLLLA